MTSVAVIGAGPAGLASAKSAIEQGLEPVVFDRNQIGGLWSQHGPIWRNMITNLSRQSCCFSDFPHKNALDFPRCQDLHRYLIDYCEHFALGKHIACETSVSSATFNGSKWELSLAKANGSEVKPAVFDKLIVASGFFSKGALPDINGIDDLGANRKYHSQQYKDREAFKDKHVIVWGNGLSGVEICADLVGSAKSVTHIIRRPTWIIPRYIDDPTTHRRLPLDLVFYRRDRIPSNTDLNQNQKNQARNRFLSQFSKQNACGVPAITVDIDSTDFTPIAISDHYVDYVKRGLITVFKLNEETRIGSDYVELSKSQKIATDAIIFATGYRFDLPFLDETTKNIIEFDGDDPFQPAILFKSTLPKGLKSLAFVGTFKGPFFGTIELQARLAAQVLAGNANEISKTDFNIELRKQRAIRDHRPRIQFPHSYVEFADSLAKLANCYPQIESDDPIKPLVFERPVVPAHFRLNGDHANRALAKETILDLNTTFFG